MPHPKDRDESPHLRATEMSLAQIKQRSYALMQLRPGQRVLDIVCGPATDTVALARLVGPSGQVFGVDSDRAMIDEARRRAQVAGVSAWVRHEQAEVTQLPFPAETFDACRSERVFQRLQDPEEALAEMVRVTKLGGWVVVADTDWGSFSVDSDEIDVERWLGRVRAEQMLHNGYSGRQLYRLFRYCGFQEIMIDMIPVILTSELLAREVGQFDQVEQTALRAGVIVQEELERWQSGLAQADADQSFFASASVVLVAGRRGSTTR